MLFLLLSCASRGPSEPVVTDPPSPPTHEGATTPSLTEDGDGLLLTWQVPAESGGALYLSRFDGRGWSPPSELVSSPDLLVNWADHPSVVRGGDGALYSHWLRREEGGPYAYDIEVLRSEDEGRSWQALGTLHQDEVATEHGFVSWVATEEGARAHWLDGRELAVGGAMTLRSAPVGSAVGAEVVIDDRVCDCCRTAAERDVVLYRDRSATEIRDLAVARLVEASWEQGGLSSEEWQIAGCPVNGPAVDEQSGLLAAAWFSEPDAAQVMTAFGRDGLFEGPILVARQGAGSHPLGRVEVVVDGAEALVVWVEQDPGGAAILARRVAQDGRVGEAVELARTEASRAAGFPALARLDDSRLLLAWKLPDAGIETRTVLASGVPPVQGPLSPDSSPRDGGPPLKLQDLDLVDAAGNVVDLPEGPLLVASWATWCAPCRSELLILQELHERGVPVLALSVDDAAQGAAVQRLVSELQLTLPVVHAPQAAEVMGVRSIPATHVFGADGELSWSHLGLLERTDPRLGELGP